MTTVSAETEPEAAQLGLLAQLGRFVVIGGFCALIDSGTYWLLLHAGFWATAAKALSFIAGTTAAFFLNRKFTFAGGRVDGASQAGAFALLYTVTFFVNVGTNALMLAVLPVFKWQYALAWIVAQGASTVINFVMLRTVVFRSR